MGKKIKVLLTSIGIVGITSTLISAYVGYKLTHPKRKENKLTPKDYDLSYEKIQIKSSKNKIKLLAWWIPAQQSNKTIIFSHGYRDSRVMRDMNGLDLAKFLVSKGYNIMMYDLRAMGESEGRSTTVGVSEKQDLLDVIEYVKTTKKSEQIILMGWSLGAAVSIMAGCSSKDVDIIIADSPFSDLKKYMKVNLPLWSRLPHFPFTYISLVTSPLLWGLRPKRTSPIKELKNIEKQKILFIHAKDDQVIPYRETQRMYNTVKDNSNIKAWYPHKGGHVKTYMESPKEYERCILEFIEATTK